MDDFELDLSALNKLKDDLEKAIALYPDKAQTTLERNGRKFRKAVKERTPITKKKHKNKLKNGYRASEVKGYGMEMHVEITTKAPHFHLVENGHEMISEDGKKIGWIPGKHMMEETRQEYEEILPKELEKMADEIFKECAL